MRGAEGIKAFFWGEGGGRPESNESSPYSLTCTPTPHIYFNSISDQGEYTPLNNHTLQETIS